MNCFILLHVVPPYISLLSSLNQTTSVHHLFSTQTLQCSEFNPDSSFTLCPCISISIDNHTSLNTKIPFQTIVLSLDYLKC